MLPVLNFHEILSAYFKHMWTIFMLKWYLDKDRKMEKLKSKFDLIQNMQMKYGGMVKQKRMPPHYPRTKKAIHSINELINYCVHL